MTNPTDGGADFEARFERLYRKYFGRVYRFFHQSGIADDEAQDLAQQTFMRIYERFASYRGESEWNFIKTTARNVMLNWVRAGKTQKRAADLVQIDDPELAIDPPAPDEPDYAEREHAELQRKTVARAVADLTHVQREALRLWILGFKYKQIADVLRTTEESVKSRLRDAKKFLRTRLGEKS